MLWCLKVSKNRSSVVVSAAILRRRKHLLQETNHFRSQRGGGGSACASCDLLCLDRSGGEWWRLGASRYFAFECGRKIRRHKEVIRPQAWGTDWKRALARTGFAERQSLLGSKGHWTRWDFWGNMHGSDGVLMQVYLRVIPVEHRDMLIRAEVQKLGLC